MTWFDNAIEEGAATGCCVALYECNGVLTATMKRMLLTGDFDASCPREKGERRALERLGFARCSFWKGWHLTDLGRQVTSSLSA